MNQKRRYHQPRAAEFQRWANLDRDIISPKQFCNSEQKKIIVFWKEITKSMSTCFRFKTTNIWWHPRGRTSRCSLRRTKTQKFKSLPQSTMRENRKPGGGKKNGPSFLLFQLMSGANEGLQLLLAACLPVHRTSATRERVLTSFHSLSKELGFLLPGCYRPTEKEASTERTTQTQWLGRS